MEEPILFALATLCTALVSRYEITLLAILMLVHTTLCLRVG
jgi:hypothetical protein